MGEWKVAAYSRIRVDVHSALVEFAEREKRTFSNLAGALLEWSCERLKAAGGTNALFGQDSNRINENDQDQRFRNA